MRKLPVLTREKAKTIFGVFKNPRHAPEFIPSVLDISILCSGIKIANSNKAKDTIEKNIVDISKFHL
ncbi:MAG: hypothetical protein WC584_02180 [Candidatus Pacearchaeota archaeon]